MQFATMKQIREQSRGEGLLHGGGGGGTSEPMEERVTRLETHMEYVRRDLDDLRAGQATILDRLNDLPTKADLNTWRWQWVATAIAIIALTVGGITGGLALIASGS
ncbi:hypothetical protein [Sphingomonas profundi]|uniref:hypothetical protein n=1 Tax=Alterirhizorhabdus profundi TaxID=2681549 RepID=UPI0012E81CE2|nr:hypothetical protein [Sphingomonas profundi]